MKKLAVQILLLIFTVTFAQAEEAVTAPITENDLLGSWVYVGFIYDGNRFAKPNPNLHLSFTFNSGNLLRLYWKRSDDNYFCDRIAEYHLQDGNKLYQKIIWTNPDNHSSCAQDPDMQLGRITLNEVLLIGKELHLVLDLNGRPFYYILSQAPALN